MGLFRRKPEPPPRQGFFDHITPMPSVNTPLPPTPAPTPRKPRTPSASSKPKVQAGDWRDIKPQQLTPDRLEELVQRLRELADADDPDTIGQARSLLRKAVTACKPLVGHARWASVQPGAHRGWDELEAACLSVVAALEDAQYSSDVDDVDALDAILEVTDALDDLNL